MKIKIAIFTGARSEFGIMKNLLKCIERDERLEYSLYVSGIHLLESFGNTYKEIEKEGLDIHYKIPIYSESKAPSALEFSEAIVALNEVLLDDKPNGVFIIGDRPEAYAMALAAHFNSIKIFHSGGGTVTKGAVDNIYRYNISNLATHHIATSKSNYERLLTLPTITKQNVYFTGSVAIDAIFKFLEQPIHISKYIVELSNSKFCLMTFHSVTMRDENMAEVMNASIKAILDRDYSILITYPNNDPGYLAILEVIKRWEAHPNVIVIKNLGVERYYPALYSCDFVIGNSSSGIIEAPYFHKQIINVGSRQDGREADTSIVNPAANVNDVLAVIELGFKNGWKKVKNHNIYGNGNSMDTILNILKK